MGSIRQHTRLAIGQFLQYQTKSPAFALDIGKKLAIRADCRGDIVGALKRYALGIATRSRHTVNLRAAATVRGKVNPLSIGRPHRLGINRASAG